MFIVSLWFWNEQIYVKENREVMYKRKIPKQYKEMAKLDLEDFL